MKRKRWKLHKTFQYLVQTAGRKGLSYTHTQPHRCDMSAARAHMLFDFAPKKLPAQFYRINSLMKGPPPHTNLSTGIILPAQCNPVFAGVNCPGNGTCSLLCYNTIMWIMNVYLTYPGWKRSEDQQSVYQVFSSCRLVVHCGILYNIICLFTCSQYLKPKMYR